MKKISAYIPLFALALTASVPAQSVRDPRDYFGPRINPNPKVPRNDRKTKFAPMENTLRRWNTIAVDASGLDHTPVAAGENRVYGDQLGPCRASRAIAIVQIAIIEAHNASLGQPYTSYVGLSPVSGNPSPDAAIAQAAHDALIKMFPSQTSIFDTYLAEDLAAMPSGAPKTSGIALGKSAAAKILTLRKNDHSDHAEPVLGVDYFTSNEPGKWRQDPVTGGDIALGALWNTVTPFTMNSAAQFRVPAPPALDSLEHSLAYVETKRLGGDGVNTPTERTADETFIGTYWAYDGTPSLCAPPRLYNQLILTVADQMGTTGIELSRLLVLANLAMADTAIAVWDSKYFYNVGRPVTMIREAGEGAFDDGNVDTVADTAFTPLGAPTSNLLGPDFTPPFPTYPSGHAGFGGSVFETLRRFYGRDDIAFTFVSDEYNGATLDGDGNARELLPRSFSNLTEAEIENGASRVYLGIHWNYDSSQGIGQGRNVAANVISTAYLPSPNVRQQPQRQQKRQQQPQRRSKR